MRRGLHVAAATALAALSLVTAARAGELIVNGGFETGDYTGWTAAVERGSEGALTVVANNGGSAPLSGFAGDTYALNANGGNSFSISDQFGGGSYALVQAFTLTSAATVNISFQQFLNTEALEGIDGGRDAFVPDTRGGYVPNENAEVDILTGSADPFTNASADIVSVLYGPGVQLTNFLIDPTPNPWITYVSTLNLAAGTYQIRFAETDNQGPFQQGVDNVSITTAGGVPEPASWALMIVGLGAAGGALRRRSKVITT
jgi:hypothetical protein